MEEDETKSKRASSRQLELMHNIHRNQKINPFHQDFL